MACVLVVDDSPFERKLVSQVLAHEDSLSIEFAEGGQDAIDRLRSGGIDIVLTDLQMPVIDGFQLTTTIRENYPVIPVIIMTGEGSEIIAMEALSHGAASYVPKAMMKDWLVRTILQTLEACVAEQSQKDFLANLNGARFSLNIQNKNVISAVVKQIEEIALGLELGDQNDLVRLGVGISHALECSLHSNQDIEFNYEISNVEGRFLLKSTVDESPVFDPQSIPTGLDAESLNSESGRNFFLMRSHFDQVDIDDDGQVATLIFKGRPPESDDKESDDE